MLRKPSLHRFATSSPLSRRERCFAGIARRVEPRAQRIDSERPLQFRTTAFVTQHRHAQAITRLQRLVAIDEHAFELRHARLGQHLQREVAQVAVVALEQRESKHGNAARYGGANPRWRVE